MVRPLLTQHCAHCHTGRDAQGNFDLSKKSTAIGSAESLIVPIGSNKSRLIDAVSGSSPAMPKNGPHLSQSQIESLQNWIDAGAPWPDDATIEPNPLTWWSLQPLSQPSIPGVNSEEVLRVRSPIDAFIISRMRTNDLTPNHQADRRTLIRRVHFDLTGLPPSAERVQTFERDDRPEAYEMLVDELLASPRFGERWGQHWLDVVHFGETHGYDKDKVRPNAWPYRDYVIRSFNADKPFSQFIEEQLAGDRISPNSMDGIVGTGFIAAGPFDFVGQIEVRDGTVEKQRVRNIDRDDMVSVTMNVFNSLTAQCARCHDHKFDPISQDDYYRLQAVFAGIDRADRPFDSDDVLRQMRRDLIHELSATQNRQSEIDDLVHRTIGPELQSIENEITQRQKTDSSTSKRPQYGYHSAITNQESNAKWVQIDLGQSQTIDRIQIVGAEDDFAGIGAGFGFPKQYRIDVSNDAQFENSICIVNQTQNDVPNPGISPIQSTAHGVFARHVRITVTKLAPRENDFIFALAELMVYDSQGRNLAIGATVSALDSIEAPVRWSRVNLVDGIFPGSKIDDSRLAQLIESRDAILHRRIDAETLKQRTECHGSVARLQRELKQLPSPSLVYAASSEFTTQGNFKATLGKPRPIHILDRGDETAPKQLVSSGGVGYLPNHPIVLQIESAETEGSRRVQLARWIAHRGNHLTWRSIVNRIWSYHFGKGIVETTNDFGRMGSLPSHPELLDWMAVELRDGNLSLKSLHRMIVMSSTYRQASSNNPTNAAIDADNRMLWRMNRRRLDAETIRDSVLIAAGRMRLEMGGPSFRPFRFEDDHSPRYHYQDYDANDASTHRRSIYRLIVRSVPDPWMAALDCADPSISVDRRNETLTALQSLALLNNPFMLRMSEHFAAEVTKSNSNVREQILAAFQQALQRNPAQSEYDALIPLANTHGMKNMCRLLMNCNEFVFLD